MKQHEFPRADACRSMVQFDPATTPPIKGEAVLWNSSSFVAIQVDLSVLTDTLQKASDYPVGRFVTLAGLGRGLQLAMKQRAAHQVNGFCDACE
jgi:hypothetical protein